MRRIVLILILLLASTYVYADYDVFTGPVRFQQSFLTGEKFLRLSETEKAYYSMGIIDGYLSAPMFGANAKYVSWISTCVQGKTNTQLSAILVKYLQDNPGRWEMSVQSLMFEAFLRSCEK